MITIPMITKEDLDEFKGKKVVLYSQRASGGVLYEYFKSYGVEVICFCKEEKISRCQCMKDKIRGLTDITPEQLPDYIKKYNDIIIQSVEFDSAQIQHAHDIATQLGVESSRVTSGELLNKFSPLVRLQKLKNPLCFWWRKIRRQQGIALIRRHRWKCLRRNKTSELMLICSPPKTADHSLMYTFDALNTCENCLGTCKKIHYINVWHSPKRLKRLICQKNIENVKVIIGVREPISQNLSMFYQRLSSGSMFEPLLFDSLEFEPDAPRVQIIKQYEQQLRTDAGNAQLWWNEHINPYTKTKKKLAVGPDLLGYIQMFIPLFQNEVLDILSYPFDQDKGYTIIKDKNIEVFLYQLEKLNSLVPELSEWVGAPFNKLEKGNVAEDKWLAESYKQAQNEIEITQEYFDKCFNEPYVKHCYSEADIGKFKARWRPHIKKES